MGVQRMRLRNPALPPVHSLCWGCWNAVEAVRGIRPRKLSRIRPCCRCGIPGAGYSSVPAAGADAVDVGCVRRHRRT